METIAIGEAPRCKKSDRKQDMETEAPGLMPASSSNECNCTAMADTEPTLLRETPESGLPINLGIGFVV